MSILLKHDISSTHISLLAYLKHIHANLECQGEGHTPIHGALQQRKWGCRRKENLDQSNAVGDGCREKDQKEGVVTDENEAGRIWQASISAYVEPFAQERQHHEEQDDACNSQPPGMVTLWGQYTERCCHATTVQRRSWQALRVVLRRLCTCCTVVYGAVYVYRRAALEKQDLHLCNFAARQPIAEIIPGPMRRLGHISGKMERNLRKVCEVCRVGPRSQLVQNMLSADIGIQTA